ncbi:MAG: DUF3828 domain-containing protein [Gluconacetobacter diazotrophicus]|nr:DUF3828 domain-containing protein [Gluconacetobacter diazotrophicus]
MRHLLGAVSCLVLTSSPPAQASRTSGTPDAFVREVYRDYGKDDRPDLLGPTAPGFFAPGLLALIRADERVPSGGVGRLDEDPLCDCQDDGGFRRVSVILDHPPGGRVEATIHAMVGTDAVVVGLDLVETGRGWRIADVHGRNIPSLVAFLRGRGPPPRD